MPRPFARTSLALAVLTLALLSWPALRAGSASPALAGAAQAGEQAPSAAAAALLYPRTILLVRHAEKSSDDPKDPALTEAGIARARALDKLLASATVTHLFASPFKRTQQTLLPLSMRTGLQPQIVPPNDPEALLSGLRNLPRNSVAVVAGHSNTVPKLIAELAKGSAYGREHPEGPKLGEEEFDRLFVVTQWAERNGTSVLELRYGE